MRIVISEVKAKSRLEEVIRETGWILEELPGQPGRLICPAEPDLTVDVERQFYQLGDEKGDVLTWLCKRFGWSFGQAARYLHHRGGLTAGQRQQVLKPPEKVKSERKEGRAGKLWPDVHERQIRQLWGYLADYPGIERLLNKTATEAILERAWIPRRFMPITGDLSGELCSGCYTEAKGWGEGRWFYEFDLSGNYAIENSSGVYCGECVSKFKRWSEGFGKLILLLQANEGRQVAVSGIACATA